MPTSIRLTYPVYLIQQTSATGSSQSEWWRSSAEMTFRVPHNPRGAVRTFAAGRSAAA